ncbi:hypothetical protein DESPIG_02052, partial [Desulfovibrio piger ATCC 29098]
MKKRPCAVEKKPLSPCGTAAFFMAGWRAADIVTRGKEALWAGAAKGPPSPS